MTTTVNDPVYAPSLSSRGWVNSLNEKADLVCGWFFTTDAFQSNLYQGKLVSLQNNIQQYTNNIPGLCRKVQQDLEQFLTRYYPEGASASVTSPGTDPTYPNTTVELNVSATVTVDGVQYSFGWLVDMADNIVSNIVRINNNGASF